MPYFSGPNGIREVADPGDRFQQSFNTARRGKLLSDFFTNGQTDLGALARLDPEAAQQIQAQQKQSGLAKMFADLYSAPEDQRPQGIAALLAADPQMGQQAMKAFDPRFAQAAVGGVQSTFVNDQGQRVAIMRDGSVQILGNNAPNNQIIDTGNGYFGVNKGNLNAAPVQVGGQQQQAPQNPQQDVQGRRVEINYDGPADERAAFDQLVAADAGQPFAPGQYSAELPPREVQGQQLRKAPPAMTPYQQASLGMQQQASQRADQNANMGPIPAGMRLVNGQLERMPGAPAGTAGQKPMPVGALRADLDIEDAIGASEQVFSLAAKHLRRMGDGSLVVGTPEAWAAKARTVTNSTTQNDRNLTELNADKTAIVNASLRLNKGVQTEGDAQRAVNELMSANDHKTTLAAMKRLIEINKRAMGLQQRKRELLRSNYGGQQQAPAGGGYRVGQIIQQGGKRYRVTGGDMSDPDVEEVR